MQSREKILAELRRNQPAGIPMPEYTPARKSAQDLVPKFMEMLSFIGGQAIEMKLEEAVNWFESWSAGKGKILSGSRYLPSPEPLPVEADPHVFADLGLLVLDAQFGVAENAAVWLSEDQMKQRVLPFICEQLLVVLQKNSLLADMHEAYERIGKESFGFGCFVAGPSKTADIEQSLVLGAHGPRSMTVLLLDRES